MTTNTLPQTTSIEQLVPVTPGEIGGKSVQTVDARDLHTWLGVGKEFANWIKERIDQYGFTQGVDYVIFAEIGKNGGRPRKEYRLTIDMAKELAMVERNKKGKEARQYFIRCEKRALLGASAIPRLPTEIAKQCVLDYLDVATLFETPRHVAQAEAVKAARLTTGVDFTPLLKHSAHNDDIPDEDVWLEPTQLGQALGLGRGRAGAIAANQLLKLVGWQEFVGNGWEPIGDGVKHAVRHFWTSGNKTGYNWKWNLAAVYKIAHAHGLLADEAA